MSSDNAAVKECKQDDDNANIISSMPFWHIDGSDGKQRAEWPGFVQSLPCEKKSPRQFSQG